MILKLPFAIKDLPVYPKDREFTAFEAMMDFLLDGPDTKNNPLELALRWNWTQDRVSNFLRDFPGKDSSWYEADVPNRKAIAQEVVEIYNSVFDRDCQLNESRIRTINARIKEGRSLKPPIGKEQFRAVFEFKKKEWEGTEQEKYLTLETLCRPTHFLNYLEAARLDFKKKKLLTKEQKEGVILSGTAFKSNG